jgi:hypothetical protein
MSCDVIAALLAGSCDAVAVSYVLIDIVGVARVLGGVAGGVAAGVNCGESGGRRCFL